MNLNVRARHIRGALAYWQDHAKRLLTAIGRNVVIYENDFVGGPGTDAGFDASGEWTITRTEAGGSESTVTRTDAVGGELTITTDANDNDGVNMQLIGESFELTADQDLYFGAFGLKLSESTQSDFFIGLAVTDTDILGGVTHRVGFEKLDEATAIKAMIEKATVETLSGTLATAVNDTPIDLEFYWDGQSLEFFINGASVYVPALTNLPNDEFMRATIQFLAGATTAKTFKLDLLRIIMIGR